MDLRQLAYVESVARLGSFTAAAREQHVAQPAVSAAIASLERRLGTQLFVRVPSGAVATETGRTLARHARRVHAELEAARSEIAQLQSLLTGTLTVGATPLLGPTNLPAAIARFHRAHPGVRIRVRTALIGDLLADLESGIIDVVLGPLDGVDPRETRSLVLHRESLTLIAPAGESTELADLADRSFICLPQGSGLRRLLEAACLRDGFRPRVDIELSDPHDIPAYVAGGLGVAIVATSIAERHQGADIVCAPLIGGPGHPPLGMVTLREPNAAAAAFVEEVAGNVSRAAFSG